MTSWDGGDNYPFHLLQSTRFFASRYMSAALSSLNCPIIPICQHSNKLFSLDFSPTVLSVKLETDASEPL